MSRITVADCRRVVGSYYNIHVDHFSSPRRTWNLARPRMLAMALAREFTDASFPAIGLYFGGRDHTTALHAKKRIDELCRTDPVLHEDRVALRQKLAEMVLKRTAVRNDGPAYSEWLRTRSVHDWRALKRLEASQ